MGKTILIATLALLAAALNASAGTLADGTWTAANCGTQPADPVLDDSSVEVYNDSLKEIKDWQQKAQAYTSCVVGEANADNKTIAEAANAQQDRFRAAVAKISAEASAARAKLDRKK